MFIYMGANNNYNPNFGLTLYFSVPTHFEKYVLVSQNKVLGKRNIECESSHFFFKIRWL